MRKLVGLVGLVLVLMTVRAAVPAPLPDRTKPPAPRFSRDRLLVAFHPSTSVNGRLQIAGASGLSVAAESRSPHFAILKLSPAARAAGQTVARALASLRSDPRVRVAEPDYQVQATALPNDPFFPDLYGLHNTGQFDGQEDADIDAPEAWEVTTGSKSVVVAVIDTGVDYQHPDLDFNILRDSQQRVVGYDFVNDDPDPMDDYGHGTHVAGTIGARANNSMGVAGVSHVVRIMPVKFLDAAGFGSTGAAIQAIDFAVSHGARILNNSWGGGDRSQLLLEAIQRAESQGALFVASAGNDSTDTDEYPVYPASYNREIENVVSVAATDNTDEIAFFSNYGERTVDVAAPGVLVLSTTPGNTYTYASGTSMAAPHVTGVAALVQAQFPGLSVSQLKARVVNSADAVESLSELVRMGRLNALKALAEDAAPPAAPGALHVTHRAQSGIRIAWTAPGDDGLLGQATSFEIRYAASLINEGNLAQSVLTTAPPAPGIPGTEHVYLLADLQPGTDYFVAVRALDNVGNPSSLATLGPVRTLDESTECVLQDGAEEAPGFAGEGGWAVTSEHRWKGASSYSDSPGSAYGNQVNASLTQSAPVPYTGGVSELKFHAKLDLEYGADFLVVEISTGDKPQWAPLTSLTGTSDWTGHRLTIPGAVTGSLRVRFRLRTDESVGRDGVWLDEIQVCTPIALCLFEETVEGSPFFSGGLFWHVTNEDHASPTHAFADSPGRLYSPSLDASLTQTHPIPVSGVLANLKFNARLDLERGYDWLRVEASGDGGVNWELLTELTGHAEWSTYQLPLSRFVDGQILVRFRLTTDPAVSYDGVWLDDIRICGETLVPGDAPVPAAPTQLQVVATGPSRIDLTWSSSSTNLAGHKVHRREENGAYSFLALVRAPVQSFIDRAVQPGTTYTYQVRATYLGLDSPPSEDAAATTPGAPDPPAAPGNLTAKVLRGEEIRLAWSDNSTNEDSFVLERRQGSGEFRTIERLTAGTNGFTDRGLAGESNYVYRVRAKNAGGESKPSNEALVATPPTGRISVSTDELDFGTIRVGRRVRKRFTIRNVGTGTLTVTVSAMTDPFSVMSGGGTFRLARGKRRVVALQFAPPYYGSFSDVVNIFCSDRDNPNVRVLIYGDTAD